tara:strand:+ start:177 stop:497 length:321 start_codon:yes stop_codon:yes gene_type:complete
MILKKIIVSLIFLFFLNGCVQNTVLLGPAITVASTGSVYQAGLSYGSSKTIEKITGKTPTENIKSFLMKNKDKDQKDTKKNADDFFKIVKKINKRSGIKNLSNRQY